jgi:hypothetical protein
MAATLVPPGILPERWRVLLNSILAARVVSQKVAVTVTNGAAAGTFTLPSGVKVLNYHLETASAIPGTPTNTNLRLGSAANGQQYIADVDVKAQGWITPTVVYAGRNPATTVHYTVASTGGTAADQDGTVLIHVQYLLTPV